MKTILLLGLPRSGTTWVGDVLGLARGVQFVNEPDNEKISFLGKFYKTRVPRFPLISPDESSPRFAKLWRHAVAGRGAAILSRSRLTQFGMLIDPWREFRVVKKEMQPPDILQGRSEMTCRVTRDNVRLIKSVHSVMCAEWVTQQVPIDRVVVVMRHPLAVLASWRRMNMPDRERASVLSSAVVNRIVKEGAADGLDISSSLQRQALQLAVLYRALVAQAKRNTDWIITTHEDLCIDPVEKFRMLYGQVGLDFSESIAEGIAAKNKAGSGYKPQRIAANEIGKWKKDFTSEQIQQVTDILVACGLSAWL